jgi:hypothetical protein
MEANPVSDSGDLADEEAILIVVFHPGGIALVRHGVHGASPNRCKNRRAALT